MIRPYNQKNSDYYNNKGITWEDLGNSFKNL